MDIHHVIKRPLVTEKALSAKGGSLPCYSFVVDVEADKPDIRKAVEKLFNVKVKSINTAIVRGKVKRVGRSTGKRPNWKKAIVELQTGNKIELFEGV